MRIAVVSDTHMPRRGPLPAACLARLRAADAIVHAGDWSDADALDRIRGLGVPLVGVRGNVEDAAVRRALPETAVLDAGGLRIAVVHDAGPESGRLERLRRRFPDAGAVVFGHSHIPLLARAGDGFLILNPGSPTDRRRSPRHTMAEITVGDGPPEVAFLAVDDPPGTLDASLVRSAS
ncbi:MAG: metallophosphoesterase [Thermoleophilia bacterium]